MSNTYTPELNLAIPGTGDVDWDGPADSNYNILDAVGYAPREDRNLKIVGGGTLLYTASSGQISFTQDILIYPSVSGFYTTIPVSQSPITVSEAFHMVYAIIPRDPQTFNTLTVGGGTLFDDQVSVPKSNTALLLAFRDNASPTNRVLLWGGGILLDGVPGAFGQSPAANPGWVVPGAITGATTLTTTSSSVQYISAASSYSVALPNPTGNNGMKFTLKRIDQTANVVTITTPSGNIEFQSTQALSGGDCITVRAYNGNYYIEG